MSNDEPDRMYVIVPRAEVESDLICSTSSYLKVIVDRAASSTVKKRRVCDLEINIDGYNDDPRELYEIPEVCEWARKEYRLLPSLGFFLAENSRYCFCGWLCGPVSKSEISSDSFSKRFEEKMAQFIVQGIDISADILRSAGADENLLSEIFLRKMQETASTCRDAMSP